MTLPRPPAPEFIFFDAFGTVIHIGGSSDPGAALRSLLAGAGVEAPLELAREAIAKEATYYRKQQRSVRTREELERLRLKCADIVVEALGGPAACPLRKTRVAEILVETFPSVAFPDVEPAVRLARDAGVRVGVLSNFSYLLPLILEDLGLLRLFDVVVYSAEVGVEKPDPVIFAEAVRRAGVAPSRAAHIGDNYDEDVIGARAGNLTPVLLDRTGCSRADDVPVATDLLEAVQLLLGPES